MMPFSTNQASRLAGPRPMREQTEALGARVGGGQWERPGQLQLKIRALQDWPGPLRNRSWGPTQHRALTQAKLFQAQVGGGGWVSEWVRPPPQSATGGEKDTLQGLVGVGDSESHSPHLLAGPWIPNGT